MSDARWIGTEIMKHLQILAYYSFLTEIMKDRSRQTLTVHTIVCCFETKI